MGRTIGIIMIVLGVVLFIWTGFTYTKTEKIIGADPIQVSADREKTVNWPPYAGGVMLVAGIVILLVSKKES